MQSLGFTTLPFKKRDTNSTGRLSRSPETWRLHEAKDSLRVRTLKTWSHGHMTGSVAAASHIPLLQQASNSQGQLESSYSLLHKHFYTSLVIKAFGFPARLSSLGQSSCFIPISSLSFKESCRVRESTPSPPIQNYCNGQEGAGTKLPLVLQVGGTQYGGLKENGPHRLIGSGTPGSVALFE